MPQHRSPAVGYEEITSVADLPDPISITADGAPGMAYVMPGSFRFLILGCNVAGVSGDVIVCTEGTAWVVLRDEWDTNRYKSQEP